MPSLLNTAIHLAETTSARWTPVGMLNTAFDCMFYDPLGLSAREAMETLSPTVPEGAVIVLSPEKDKTFDVLDLRDDHAVEDVLAALEKSEAHTVTISGCGSSFFGSIALGRTVAKILKGPVATIVAGCGLRDAVGEIGSGLMFADANWALHAIDRFVNPFLASYPQALRNRIYDWAYVSPEAASLHRLLLANRGQIKRIVGHSKGNYAVAAGLFGLKASVSEEDLAEIEAKTDMDVFTFGCWVELPHNEVGEPFGKLRHHQYVGGMDPFQLNSPPDKLAEMWLEMLLGKPHEDERVVPMVCHDVIPWWPVHMPMERLLH